MFRHPASLIFYIMAQYHHVTQEGFNKLMEELAKLRAQRPVISAQIAEARDKGDLSENAEYDAAREAQGMLEMQIAKLESTIASARIIDASKIDTKSVQMLTTVTLMNHTLKRQMEYTIVSETEADLKSGKLSVGTPIAKALMGHKKGETVDVQVPSGIMKLEILDITLK